MTEGMPQEPAKKGGKGCKIALIIVGILVILGIIAGWVLCSYGPGWVRSAAVKGLEQMEEQVVDKLPDEFDADEMCGAFKDAREYVAAENVSMEQFGTRLQSTMSTIQAAMEDESIDMDEAREILEDLKDLKR